MGSNGRHDKTVSSLGRYWDEVVQGRASDAADLDPALAATVRHLHTHDDALGADRRFADRLLEDLMHAATHHDPSPSSLTLALPLVRAGRAGLQAPRLATATPRWAQAQLATAALVLLALVATFFVVGPGRPGQPETSVFLAAISATPATQEPVVTETLFDATVDGLPTGWGQFVLIRWRLRPTTQALVFPPTNGVQVFKVESGEVTATVGGVEHRLAAGEMYVFADPAQEVAFRLSGPEEATLLRGLAVTSWQSASADRFATTFEFLLEGSTSTLPGGSGHLVAQRLTLPPGSTLPPQLAGPFDWIAVWEGTLGLTLEGDSLPGAWTAGEEKSLTRDSLWPNVPAGTRMTLRNAGDEPLVLYRMTLTPDEAATPVS